MACCSAKNRRGDQCLRAPHHLGFHVFAPLAQIGRRRKRERAALDAARAQVKDRSGGFCEAYDLLGANDKRHEVCGTILLHRGEHAHHCFPEDHDAGFHDADRMLWLCSTCHVWLHEHPAAAVALWLLRPVEEAHQ